MPEKCDFCGREKDRLAIFEHPTGRILRLCFHGCQHFPEPFQTTGLPDTWIRIDGNVKFRPQPRLRYPRK